jgi:hypothetical protein
MAIKKFIGISRFTYLTQPKMGTSRVMNGVVMPLPKVKKTDIKKSKGSKSNGKKANSSSKKRSK